MISSVVPTNFPFVRGLTRNKNSILSEWVADTGRRRKTRRSLDSAPPYGVDGDIDFDQATIHRGQTSYGEGSPILRDPRKFWRRFTVEAWEAKQTALF